MTLQSDCWLLWRKWQVVTHQWSGDPSIAKAKAEEKEVVTHQWSGDPSINPFVLGGHAPKS